MFSEEIKDDNELVGISKDLVFPALSEAKIETISMFTSSVSESLICQVFLPIFSKDFDKFTISTFEASRSLIMRSPLEYEILLISRAGGVKSI